MSMDIITKTPFEQLAPLRRDYNKRIRTFDHRWPPGVPVSPRDLAKDGFYYTGLGDKVQCTHCGGILSGWCEGDVVALEHRQHFPNCPWVRHGSIILQGNVPSTHPSNVGDLPGFAVGQPVPIEERFGPYEIPGAPRPKFKNYAMESARMASFKGWPTQITQRPDALCKAGFFYLGEGDKCKCFYCGGILLNWELEDNPLLEHAKWFPKCPWIKLKINNVQNEENKFGPIEQDERGLVAGRAKICQQLGRSVVGHLLVPKGTSQPTVTTRTSQPIVLKGTSQPHILTRTSQPLILKGTSQPTISTRTSQPLVRKGTSQPPIPTRTSQPHVFKGASQYPLTTGTNQLSFPKGISQTPIANEDESDEREKINEILRENQNLKEQRLCKICLDENAGVLFEPCGHICCCDSCGVALKQCPICRQSITKFIKAYIS